jgi:hypothetical protein
MIRSKIAVCGARLISLPRSTPNAKIAVMIKIMSLFDFKRRGIDASDASASRGCVSSAATILTV